MEDSLFDRIRVIDIDTHVTEPAGVWTDRLASKWGDRVPRIQRMGDGPFQAMLTAHGLTGATQIAPEEAEGARFIVGPAA